MLESNGLNRVRGLEDVRAFQRACGEFESRVEGARKGLLEATAWMSEYWKDSTFETVKRLVDGVCDANDGGLARTKKAIRERALPFVEERIRILMTEKPR